MLFGHLVINNLHQDGPSLESSSYLNMTLRYLGQLDFLDFRTLDLFPPPPPPHTYSYLLQTHLSSSSCLLLTPPTSSWYILAWFGMVWSSYVRRFQCYSNQKSFLGGWHKRLYTWHKRLCDIAIIASSSRSRSLEF